MSHTSPSTIQVQTDGPERTMALAATLARRLEPGDVVTLDGPLGSGKTCFVRGMAAGLGIDPAQVSSPTFVICQEYASPGAIHLAHIDAYRLSGADDLESIGFDELLASGEAIIAIEWPSRIAAALPRERLDVVFAHLGPETRDITICGTPGRSSRLAPLADPAHVDGHACPACGTGVTATSEHFPFCSRRCRMVDLGRWFGGRYTISRPVEDDDLLG